jgi:hypothetical protein
MLTTMSATLTPTAREAARACQGALQACAPTVPHPEIHRSVHGAATALREALAAGVALPEILAALILATAPTAPEAPPPPPWAPCLGLSLSAFADSGAALGVRFPAHGMAIWMSGSETQARAIAAERRIAAADVWRLDRMQQEARRAGLDETATIADLVTVLGGVVRDWRPAA